MIEELSLLPLVVSIPAFILIGYAIVDIVRRADLPGLRKALWIAVAILLPVAGVFVYLLARPFDDPAEAPTEGNDKVSALMALLVDHEQGAVSDDAFDTEKQRLFGDAAQG